MTLTPTASRGTLNYALNTRLDEALDYEVHLQEIAGRTVDHHEGVQAFVEERPPKFIGKWDPWKPPGDLS